MVAYHTEGAVSQGARSSCAESDSQSSSSPQLTAAPAGKELHLRGEAWAPATARTAATRADPDGHGETIPSGDRLLGAWSEDRAAARLARVAQLLPPIG